MREPKSITARRRNSKSLWTFTLFFLGLAQLCQGAEIQGTVTDQSGAVLVEALVTLREISSEIQIEQKTGQDGRYRFNGIGLGSYTLSVAAEQFSEAAKTVVLSSPGQSEEVDFTLRVGSIDAEILVTANRGRRDSLSVPSPTQALREAKLEVLNPTSTGEALTDANGVTPAGSGPYLMRPRLRGLDSTRLLILVDGQRLNHARVATDRAGIEPSLIDPALIDEVEVIGGTGTSLYGSDALTGAINIITRRPKTSDSLRVSGGFDGFFSSNERGRRGSATIGLSGSRFAMSFRGSLERFGDYDAGKDFARDSSLELHETGVLQQRDTVDQLGFNFGAFPDPFNQPFQRTDARVPNSAAHGSNLSFRGFYTLSERQTVNVNWVRRRNADIGFPDFEPPFFFQRISIPASNLDKVSGGWQLRNLGGPLSSLSLNVYHQKHQRLLRNQFPVQFPAPDRQTFFPINVFRLNILSDTGQNVESTGVDAQANFLVSPRNVLTAGFTLYQDDSRDSRTTLSQLNLLGQVDLGSRGPEPTVFPAPLPLGPPAIDHPVRVPDSSLRDMAFFLQDEWEINRLLRVVGSIRFDRYRARSKPTDNYQVDPLIVGAQPPLRAGSLPSLQGESISRNAFTGDIGLVVRPLPQFSLIAHYARSYRHPNLEELFFAGPATVGVIVPNLRVEPETGDNLDLGFKFRTGRFRGSLIYFDNRYDGFISTEITAVGNSGPLSQAVNFSDVRIRGLEGDVETSFQKGHWLISPWARFFYNRGDIQEGINPLTGRSLAATPQDNITPFRSNLGIRLSDRRQRYWVQYSNRYQAEVDRVPQTLLESPFLIAQDLLGLEGFSIHRLGWGVNWHRESFRWGLSFAVENMSDRFYREQFEFAPARGRTLTIGLHIDTF